MIHFVLLHGSTIYEREKVVIEAYRGIATEIQNMKVIVKLVIYGALEAKMLQRRSKDLAKRILDL